MAKLEPFTHLDNFRGKYSRTDKVYAKVRVVDDQMIGVRIKHPVTNEPPSAAQQTVMDKFKTVQAQVSAILADPEQKAEKLAKFKQQHKCKTLRGYIFQDLYHAEQEGGQG